MSESNIFPIMLDKDSGNAGKENNIPIMVNDVLDEISRATATYGRFNSMHEGYAILKEEVEEAWIEIKANNQKKALAEMKQVAAMALKFLIEFDGTE